MMYATFTYTDIIHLLDRHTVCHYYMPYQILHLKLKLTFGPLSNGILQNIPIRHIGCLTFACKSYRAPSYGANYSVRRRIDISIISLHEHATGHFLVVNN